MRSVSMFRSRTALLALFALVVGPGCERASSSGAGAVSAADSMVVPGLKVGADLEASPEYQFSRIHAVLPLEDGSFWVADGSEGVTAIRRFDESGAFLGQVSRQGSGPGEYRRPASLSLLADGSVLLTDVAFPRRLTIFEADGSLRRVASVPDAHSLAPSGASLVDSAGNVWRMSMSQERPGPNRHAFWARVRLENGESLDTIHPPTLSPIAEDRAVYRSPDGRVTRGFGYPYLPRPSWTRLRSGRALIAPEDAYRVYLTGPVDGAREDRVLLISRDVPPVPVSEPERSETRADIRRAVDEYGVTLDVPDLPPRKPHILGLRTSIDERIMVKVSMPSIGTEAGWAEPAGWDIFDSDGGFLGRVVLPAGHRVMEIRDDQVWSVFTDEFGVESVHRSTAPTLTGRG